MVDRKARLYENDVIGIVRGIRVPWDVTLNYDLFVYRLRRYTSEYLLTIEIDDDETYEVSDDDAGDHTILDPIDPNVEHDLCIQLSRNFNAEIKEEFEEYENFCKEVKKGPSNFFDIETTDYDHESTNHEPIDDIDNPQRMISKVINCANRKKDSVVIMAKPMKKRRNNTENTNPTNGKRAQSTSVIEIQRKDKLRRASQLNTQKLCGEKEKTKTTAKVKYTKDNRGSFLTDPTQMPGLPVSLKELRKQKLDIPSMPTLQSRKESPAENKEIDAILSELDIINDTPPPIDNFDYHEEHYPMSDDGPSIPKIQKTCVNDSGNDRTDIKECGFQNNPCHEMISILTSYDAAHFRTVDAFCRSINVNVDSFGYTFKDYSEYRE